VSRSCGASSNLVRQRPCQAAEGAAAAAAGLAPGQPLPPTPPPVQDCSPCRRCPPRSNLPCRAYAGLTAPDAFETGRDSNGGGGEEGLKEVTLRTAPQDARFPTANQVGALPCCLPALPNLCMPALLPHLPACLLPGLPATTKPCVHVCRLPAPASPDFGGCLCSPAAAMSPTTRQAPAKSAAPL
jgi:hypothetical protein